MSAIQRSKPILDGDFDRHKITFRFNNKFGKNTNKKDKLYEIIEFLGTWKFLHNPDFNRVGFDTVRMQAGLNSFTIKRLLRLNKNIKRLT